MPRTADRVVLELKVNGEGHQLEVKPWHSLLEVLRDYLGLQGAKRGCEDGVCGTCTVTLNGAVARACRVPLERAQDSAVLTLEGLGSSGRLHPLQEAFMKADAVQCGFCTPGMIMAAKDAAVRLKTAVLTTASELLEQPPDDLELCNGRVALSPAASSKQGGSSALAVSLAQVAQARGSAGLALRFGGLFDPTPLIKESADGALNLFPVYVSATHLAEVEVDPKRGEARVVRLVAAHDVGRAMFPLGLKGQIEGSVAMGVGFALKEEFRPSETVGFKQYRIPTTRDMPEVVPLLVEGVDPSADLGAKGAAECALVPSAPAIANAIADATGARIHDLPATPPRLLEALAQAEP